MVDITPHALANAIMGQLYDVLNNGDATVPKSPDNFISWVTPAYPYDPSDFDFLVQGLTGVVPAGGDKLTQAQLDKALADDTIRLYQQAEQLARLVDFIPEVTRINNNQFATFNVNNNAGTLSDQYEIILKMSQVMDQELDAATKAKIAQFRALLQTTTTHTDLVTGEQTQVVGPSPMVQAYNQKMMAYDSAALTYNAARIAAQAGDDPAAVQNFAINAAILRNQVTAAMDDWIANGYKNDYEEIAAYINAVQQRDLNLLKQEYEDDLTKAALTGIPSNSTFYYTSLIPGDFANSPAWTTFSFDIGNISGHARQQLQHQRLERVGHRQLPGTSRRGGQRHRQLLIQRVHRCHQHGGLQAELPDRTGPDRPPVVQGGVHHQQDLALRPGQPRREGQGRQ